MLLKKTLPLLLTLSIAFPTNAEEAEKDAIPLMRDDPAPFDGILMPIERAARLYENIQICEAELEIEKNTCHKQMNIERNLREQQVASLTAALEQARKDAERSWYEDPVLMAGTGVGVGAVVATAATVGLLWLAAQVRIEVPAP